MRLGNATIGYVGVWGYLTPQQMEPAMALRIDDPEADELAEELARRTGAPVEQAVIEALRAQLAREKANARKMARIREIQEHFASLPVLDDRSDDEILGYDENGLPS